jgi:Protein of unknown function (DUF2857)
MAMPHPLNQAVIQQAMYDMRNGQLRRCEGLGFTEDILDALKHPANVIALAHARVQWVTFQINRDVVMRLLNRVPDIQKEVETIDRMLRLGASTEMLSQFYGLNHQEVALRRTVLGLPDRKGRWPVLTEEQDTELWQSWSSSRRDRGIDPDDDTAMLDLAMELSEKRALPLAVVWTAIRDWIDQGLM